MIYEFTNKCLKISSGSARRLQPPSAMDLNFGLSPCFLTIKSSSNVVFLPGLFFEALPNSSFQLSLFFNSLTWFESSQPFGIIFWKKIKFKTSLKEKILTSMTVYFYSKDQAQGLRYADWACRLPLLYCPAGIHLPPAHTG